MDWIRSLTSYIARKAQFKVRLGGILFFEHLVTSFILSVALVSFLLLISGSLIRIIDFIPNEFIFLSAFCWFFITMISFIFVFLFLLKRLTLVHKNEGTLAFYGALLGELIVLIPFLSLVFFIAMIGSTL